MTGLRSGFPRPADIRKLNLDAFDIQRNGRRAGERQFNGAVRPSPFCSKRTASNDKTSSRFWRSMPVERTASTRLKTTAARRRSKPLRFLPASSHAKRLTATENCPSRGDQAISATLKTLSCKCVETTARSSLSSATSLRSVMQALPHRQCIAGMAMRQTTDIRRGNAMRNRA